MKKNGNFIMRAVIMFALVLTFLTSGIQPVKAEYHETANREDAVTAQATLVIYVRNDAGTIVNSYSDESARVSVQGRDVEGAIASAEATILESAMSWLSDKGTVVSEEVQDYVNVYDYGPGLYRMRFIEAIATAENGAETNPVTPDPEPEPDTNGEPIPLEISGAGEYVCGPNAGSYCITINQYVAEVTSVKFRMTPAPSGRNFVHSVTITKADGCTYISVPAYIMNGLNQSDMDMTYEVTVKTSAGTASLFMTVRGYYYANLQETPDTGWKQVDGVWYYLSPEGYALTGWQTIEGKTYLFDSSGRWQAYKGWKQMNGKWYYFNTDSSLSIGWKKIDNIWYFFDEAGVMQTGWKTIDGVTYNFGTNGAMKTGWKQMDGKWYYFGNDGSLKVNWSRIDNKWYYLGADGAMQTGWKKIDGVWYYLNSEMKTDWQKIDGQWYYLGSNGAMRTSWQKINGTWYYMGTDGAMRTDWQKIDGTWYYMGTNGAMRTGWQKIGNVWYYFGTDGAMRTGWKLIDGVWYYFKSSGAMTSNETLTIDGSEYSFASNGAWIH